MLSFHQCSMVMPLLRLLGLLQRRQQNRTYQVLPATYVGMHVAGRVLVHSRWPNILGDHLHQ
jgi:hypothetical protein